MKAEIVLTKKQILDILFRLVKSKTCYNNSYPYNLGYVHQNGTQSFDCWNLHKAIINSRGKCVDFKPGQYQKDLSLTGDCDGATLLESCTERSRDFSKIKEMPWGTYIYMNGHAGWFIGEFELEDGKVYNVIECTAAWDRKVLASYVDEKGQRCHWKGCKPMKMKDGSICKWEWYGLLSKWIDYSEAEEVKPVKTTEPISVPTNGCNCPGFPQPYLKYGYRSEPVRGLQKILNSMGFLGKDYKRLEEDGVFGRNTEFAVADFQGRNGLVKDGVYGPLTYQKLYDILKG